MKAKDHWVVDSKSIWYTTLTLFYENWFLDLWIPWSCIFVCMIMTNDARTKTTSDVFMNIMILFALVYCGVHACVYCSVCNYFVCFFFFSKSVWNNSEIWIHNQQWKKIPKTDFEYTAKCMEQEQYWLIDSKMTVTECMQYKQQVVMVQTFAFSSYAQANDLECLGLSRGC